MSRSGYDDSGCDNEWNLIRYRGQVASAIRGKRGQSFLREMLKALDAMPEKRLIQHDLVRESGAVCAIGCVGQSRGIDMTDLDPLDPVAIAATFGIAQQLVCEIEYENDEVMWRTTPERRWQHMRDWTAQQIEEPPD